MAEYTFELFAENPSFSESVSSFTARIEPPVSALPERPFEDYNYDGLEIRHYATTESASVYRIDHTREQLTHAARTQQVVDCLNKMSAILNGIETNNSDVWAEGEERVNIHQAGEV